LPESLRALHRRIGDRRRVLRDGTGQRHHPALGTAAGAGLDSAKTEALCKSFIDRFVELHRVDYNACGLGDLGKPEGYVAGRSKAGASATKKP
jgi:aminoglycoside phosphotransferase (APT) family kinase protein